MKVALVHDYLKEYGGAERVLEAFHEIWPEAPVITSVYLPEFLGPHKERFQNWDIRPSFFQKVPFREKLISPMRLFSSRIFESFDLSSYDAVVVSATGAYIPNLIIRGEGTLFVCYCHTPPRYLYEYPTARNWKKTFWGRVAGEYINHRLRLTDYLAGQRPDFFITNSNEVAGRISKFYRRPATVVYPPVEIVDKVLKTKKKEERNKKSYYLAGGRLARAKHIDLAIEAANKLGLRLKIFGKAFAGYESQLKKMAGETVEFTGEVTEDELIDLYRNCKALIYPSEFEDFGIMPVEAQALGKPVIAYRSGGVEESIIEGKTGLFFDDLMVESISSAIRSFEKKKWQREDALKNAAKFSKKRFKREITKFIKSKYARIT